MNIEKIYNVLFSVAVKALADVTNGQGEYTGILKEIKMEGSPTEENLELAFENLDIDDEKKMKELYEKYK